MFTRRKLFSVCSLGLFGPNCFAFAKENRQIELKDHQQWDYIVAGCGATGLMAAITAAENGVKNILIVEKEATIGGASLLCEGVWSLAGTDIQEEKGITDNPENFYENLIKDAKGTNDPSLVKAYVDNCLSLYYRFSDNGIRPLEVIKNTGMNAPRGHRFDPLEVIIYLRKTAEDLGVQILTGVKAENLLFDKNNTVTGLMVKQKEVHYRLRSKLGVLLATGGFSRNGYLIAKYAPKLSNAVRLSCAGAQGDGLLMALDAGADIRDIHNVRAAYGFILNPSSVMDITQIIYSGAIIVNPQGHRFVNESLPYKDIGEIVLHQPSRRSYMLFDSKILKAQMEHRTADAKLFAPLTRGEIPYFMSAAESIEELAKISKLPVDALTQTVRDYNLSVRNGLDKEFGRRHLTLDYGTMREIQTPPFYLVPATCASMGTNGGLRVNEKTQVMKKDSSVIKGLFAAGEAMGGFHGNSFMGGTSYGKALVFGHINGNFISTLQKNA